MSQSYSLTFRQAAPKFNRLIWSYHWLQMALYHALLDAPDPPTREANVARDVELFRRMASGDGRYAPTQMPMSAAVAPTFTARYPAAAVIFDNLHSLHDVVSDVLASRALSPGAKREAILLAMARYRDTTSFTTTREEWLDMSRSMGAVDTTQLVDPPARCD